MAESRGLKGLENWAKKVTAGYNGVNVTDMASSFRDGLAFCAIIHHYYPELIDFESLSKENILHNNSLAFSTAEKQLGIPALLDAEDMVKYSVPDRLSIITYLSQLYNCFENQNRVNKVRPAIKRIQSEKPNSSLGKVPLGDQKNTGRSHELCQICKHRVFILERLMVAGKLYHRTCFRCCKCDTILKPGAYVEGDSLGSYECAVCPRDEKKEQRNETSEKVDSAQHSESDVSLESSKEPTPEVSPAVTPKPPVLSSRFNSARTSFLKDSIHNEKSEDVNNHESVNGAVPSHDSFSVNLDQALEDLHDDSEAVKDEEIPDRSSRSVSLSSFGSQDEAVKKTSESSINGKESPANKPYQSVFTREVLHMTPLKSSGVPKAKQSPSVSTLDSLYSIGNRKAGDRHHNYDIPLVRSSKSTSSVMPRPSSSSNLQSVRRSSGPELDNVEKVHSDDNISALCDLSQSKKQLRKGSLDRDVKVRSDDFITGTDRSVSDIISPKQDLDSEGDVVLRRKERSKSGGSAGLSEMTSERENTAPKRTSMSVKELIKLREASIHETAAPTATKPALPKKPQRSVSSASSKSLEQLPPVSSDATMDSVDAADDKEPQIVPDEDHKPAAVQEKIPEVKVETAEEIPDESSPEESEKPKDSTTEEQKAKEGEEEVPPESSASRTKLDEQDMYPDDLNPFGDDDEDDSRPAKTVEPGSYPDTLNPFGDEEEEEENTAITSAKKITADDYDDSKNPFADEDDDEQMETPKVGSAKPPRPPLPSVRTSSTLKSPQYHHSSPSLSGMDSPTGSMSGTHKKRKAPKPPHVRELFLNTSSANSDSPPVLSTPSPKLSQTSPSPKILKNKRAPPPPSPVSQKKEEHSTMNGSTIRGKLKKDEDNMKAKSTNSLSPKSPKSPSGSQDDQWKKKKRPAPPVPIPSRREIKKIPLHEIKAEMNEIEEKQNELEKQGRELEVIIRDRDKDEEPTVEEEEYIMQLFELVNQKNALFRRQAELMYIKRSQRLEEEQVELEYQIRCLMMKPASQKTDEDKAKEDQLVQRLLDVVDQRNEIVDSIEMDRKRENEEDVCVQEQAEKKNGDLPITAEIKEKSKKKKKEKKQKEKEEKKQKEKEEKKLKEKEDKKIEKKKEDKKIEKEKLKESKTLSNSGTLRARTLFRK